MQTVQLSINLDAQQANLYSVFGNAASAMQLPAAFQVDTPFGADTGGVAPGLIAVQPIAEFDSWLTVGPTDGTTVSSVGVDFSSWTATSGLSVADGGVFVMDPTTGGTGNVVVAQVTQPAGTSGSATMSAQGRMAGADLLTADDWQCIGATWSWGLTTAVTVVATDGVAGYTTIRLSASLPFGAANVYAMAGCTPQTGGGGYDDCSPMSFPAAYQVAPPFGGHVGGVNPAFFGVNVEAEFDSWLTVGMTDNSSPNAIAMSPGLGSSGLDAWDENTPFSTSDGAVFWMVPSSGPSGADIVFAQLTIPTEAYADAGVAMATLQGQNTAGGEDWHMAYVTWSWGTPGHSSTIDVDVTPDYGGALGDTNDAFSDCYLSPQEIADDLQAQMFAEAFTQNMATELGVDPSTIVMNGIHSDGDNAIGCDGPLAVTAVPGASNQTMGVDVTPDYGGALGDTNGAFSDCYLSPQEIADDPEAAMFALAFTQNMAAELGVDPSAIVMNGIHSDGDNTIGCDGPLAPPPPPSGQTIVVGGTAGWIVQAYPDITASVRSPP